MGQFHALGITFQQVRTNRVSASRMQHISQIRQVSVPFFFEVCRPRSALGQRLWGPVTPRHPLYVTDLLATSDGLALIKVFTRIEKRKTASHHRAARQGDRGDWLSHYGAGPRLLAPEAAKRNTSRFQSRLRSAKLRHSQASIEDVDYRAARRLAKAASGNRGSVVRCRRSRGCFERRSAEVTGNGLEQSLIGIAYHLEENTIHK
jgi:hypothetical protein